MEADLLPRRRPDLAINTDGAIGEKSLFHQTSGYCAHGVGQRTTATLDARLFTRIGGRSLTISFLDLDKPSQRIRPAGDN
jgi:hypothetical protein